jgi:hypothetical protein
MKVLGAVQMAIHSLHQSVNHIAGSMCFRMIIGNSIGSNVFPQFYYRIYDDSWYIILFAPFDQPSDSLRKRYFAFGTITIPYLRCDIFEDISVFPFGTVTDFDEHM